MNFNECFQHEKLLLLLNSKTANTITLNNMNKCSLREFLIKILKKQFVYSLVRLKYNYKIIRTCYKIAVHMLTSWFLSYAFICTKQHF
jgi:hypothetical protein